MAEEVVVVALEQLLKAVEPEVVEPEVVQAGVRRQEPQTLAAEVDLVATGRLVKQAAAESSLSGIYHKR